MRSSVFPELVLSNSDGGYRFHTPYNIRSRDAYANIMDTGGWAAATQNAAEASSYALGLVFGRDPTWPEQRKLKHTGRPHWQNSATVYGAGDTRSGERDYTVINMDNRVIINPGDCFTRRTYLVIGTLSDVAEAARKLASPQPTLEKPSPDAEPLCQLYANPVRHQSPHLPANWSRRCFAYALICIVCSQSKACRSPCRSCGPTSIPRKNPSKPKSSASGRRTAVGSS